MYRGRLVAVHSEWEDDPGKEASWAVKIPDHLSWIGEQIASEASAGPESPNIISKIPDESPNAIAETQTELPNAIAKAP